MRYYLIGNDEEHVVDLKSTIRHSADLIEFKFATIDEKRVGHSHERNVFVKRMAGIYFSSFDGKRWEKLAKQDIPTKFLNVNRTFDLFRGYKPSSLNSGGAGGLVTQMPGKVVKIPVKVGDKVSKGQTVIILEAMKMENEIKTSIDGVVKAIFVKEGDALDQGVAMLDVVKE